MTDGTENAGGESSGALTFEQAVDRASAYLERESSEEETNPEGDEGERETATPKTNEAEDGAEVDTDQAEPDDADADEEADPDDDADDAEEQSGHVTDDAKVTLSDGSEISLGDLKAGYLRTSDYTRKTQELAKERTATREKSAKLDQFAGSILERLKMADALANLAQPMQPPQEWRESDPVRWAVANQDYQEAIQDWQRRVAHIKQGIQETENVRGEHRGELSKEELQQAREQLMEKIPDLKDKAKAEVLVREFYKAAESIGFSTEDVQGWRDPRMIQLLHMASKAHKLEQAKPRAEVKTKGKPPVQRADQRKSLKETARAPYQKAKRRFAQTGSMDDAVNAAAMLMGGLLKD